MHPIIRAALISAAIALIASGCGQQSGATSVTATSPPPPTSSPQVTSTPTSQEQPVGKVNPVADTNAWIATLPAHDAAGVASAAMYPTSHGKVLAVGLTLVGPTAAQRHFACRVLYPHFREALPLGKVEAVLFANVAGKFKLVSSTYADDVRPCDQTGVVRQ